MAQILPIRFQEHLQVSGWLNYFVYVGGISYVGTRNEYSCGARETFSFKANIANK